MQKIPIPRLKRLFDIIFSFITIIVTIPLFIIILLIIFIEHIFLGKVFSSLFYTEKRISQGNVFNLVKFNIFKPSIISKLKKEGTFIHTKKLEHGGGLTIFGNLLKKVYIDELPQLFNILKGDISIVGPRPVNLEVYQSLIDRGIKTKSIIKAGLTGKFQSLKGETKKTDVELDQEYIDFCKNSSSWKIVCLDIKIIFLTIIVMLRAEGV